MAATGEDRAATDRVTEECRPFFQTQSTAADGWSRRALLKQRSNPSKAEKVWRVIIPHFTALGCVLLRRASREETGWGGGGKKLVYQVTVQ